MKTIDQGQECRKRIGAAAVVACLFSGTIFFAGYNCVLADSASAPKVRAQELEFNFGTARQNQDVRHVFSFENIGGAPLKVRKVRSSCGCTAALASKNLLQPGESGEIQVTFKTGKRHGFNSKSVFLYTNDPEKAVTEFRIMGNILVDSGPKPTEKIVSAGSGRSFWKNLASGLSNMQMRPESAKPLRSATSSIFVKGQVKPVVADPNACRFEDVRLGSTASKIIILSHRQRGHFQITGSRCTLPFVKANPAAQQDGSVKVKVSLTTEAPPGWFLGSLVFYTDIPDQPSVIVRVSGHVIREE